MRTGAQQPVVDDSRDNSCQWFGGGGVPRFAGGEFFYWPGYGGIYTAPGLEYYVDTGRFGCRKCHMVHNLTEMDHRGLLSLLHDYSYHRSIIGCYWSSGGRSASKISATSRIQIYLLSAPMHAIGLAVIGLVMAGILAIVRCLYSISLSIVTESHRISLPSSRLPRQYRWSDLLMHHTLSLCSLIINVPIVRNYILCLMRRFGVTMASWHLCFARLH